VFGDTAPPQQQALTTLFSAATEQYAQLAHVPVPDTWLFLFSWKKEFHSSSERMQNSVS